MKQTKYYATSTEYWQDPNKDNIQLAICTVHDYAADTEHTLGEMVIYYTKHGEGQEIPPIVFKEPVVVTKAQYTALENGETVSTEDGDLTFDSAETYYIKEV